MTLFLALAVLITMPGFSVLICAVDFTSESERADAAGGIISDMRDISGDEMSGAVYYTGSGWKSRVEKFKDDLTSGNVLLLSGKRADAVYEKFSSSLPATGMRTDGEQINSTGDGTLSVNISDMRKYLKNDHIPMLMSVGKSESIDVMTGNLSLSFPLAGIAGSGGADLSLSLIYNSSESNTTDVSWTESFYTCYFVCHGEMLVTTDENGDAVCYYGETNYIYVDTEKEMWRALQPYVNNYGTAVIYEGRDAIYYADTGINYGEFRTPLPVSAPRKSFSPSNGLAPGWKFDIPALEKLKVYDNSVTDKYYMLYIGGESYRIKNLTFENRKISDMTISAVSDTVCGKQAAFLAETKHGEKYYFDSDGNAICFSDRYGNTIKYTFTNIGDKPCISSLSDDFGRSINIIYNESGTVARVSADGNEDVFFGFSGSDDSGRTLDFLRYGETETTSFEYYGDKTGVSCAAKGTPDNWGESVAVSTQYRLISRVTYPCGDTTDYDYLDIFHSWGSNGTDTTFAVSERYDTVSGEIKNFYTYSGASDYYDMVYSNSLGDAERKAYFDGFEDYTADVLSQDGKKRTHYKFGRDNLCIEIFKTARNENSGAEIVLKKDTISYNSYLLKSEVIYEDYASGGQYARIGTESFSYDAKGNVTRHKEISGKTVNYVYDARYGMVTSETSYQDADTKISVVYTLTDDKKSVAAEKIYANGNLKSHIDYVYDGRGNIVLKTEHNTGGNTVTVFAFSDNIPYCAGMSISGTQYTESYTYDAAGRLLAVTDAQGNTTAKTYDLRGRLLSVTYANGSTEIYSYDAVANTAAVTSRSGLTLTYIYNGYGNLVAVKHGETILESHTYDEYGRLSSDIKYGGGKTVYEYDILDRLISKKEYDAENRIVMQTNVSYTVTEDGLFRTQTTIVGDSGAPSAVTAEYTDSCGFVVRKSRINGTEEYANEYTYDNFGNVISIKLFSGEITRYVCDYAGNVTQIIDALGNITAKTYDMRGNLLSVTDARGNTTAYTYDILGRKTSETAPLDGEITSTAYFIYDILGRVTEERRQNNAIGAEATYSRTVNTYDSMGNLLSSTAYDGASAALVSTYTYDAAGFMLTMTAGGKTTSYSYDLFGRKTKITDALGAEETFVYRPDGTLIEKHDRNGTKFTYTYDSMLRTVSEKAEKAGSQTKLLTYTYSATGAVLTKQNENVTLQYAYDSLGRMISETEISGNTSVKNEYFYNSRDLRTEHKLYRNDILVSWLGYTYDALGRVISVYEKELHSESVTTVVTPVYNTELTSGEYTITQTDPVRNRVEIIDTRTNTRSYFCPESWAMDPDDINTIGTVTFDGTSYSGSYRTEQTLESGEIITYPTIVRPMPAEGLSDYVLRRPTYILNEAGETIVTLFSDYENSTEEYPNGLWTCYVYIGRYDNSHLIVTETHIEETVIIHEPFVQYTYDAVGNRTSEIKDDGSVITYTYNAANLLSNMKTHVNGVLWREDAYEYYLSGNVKSITGENGRISAYAYDDLGRLKTESMTDGTDSRMVTYTYDAAGNRATVTRNGSTVVYTYDDNNRLISQTGAANAKLYTYDANGNLLTVISGGDYAGAYSYDLFGMQITYSLDGTSVTYYTYRPDGLRHSIQGKAHAWDNGNIVADMGAETVYYIRALTLVYAKDGSTKTYYRFNGHGDVIALANASGAVIKRYKYDAFGVEENPDVFDTNVFRYCAEYYDIETKTVYLRARYYDAETGRFTQQDGWNYAVPGFPLSLNLYTYCNNDPINMIDPSGRWPDWGKLLESVATIAMGVVAVAVATAAAPITAMATAAVAVTTLAGLGSVAFGAFDAYEAVTGKNQLKDDLGERTYGYLEFACVTVASLGTEFIVNNPLQFYDDSSSNTTSGYSYCEDDFKDDSSYVDSNDTFVPEEYWERNAPLYGTPNDKVEYGKYNVKTGNVERSTVIYDSAGRQSIRIDYTNHGRPDHCNPHIHYRSYGKGDIYGRQFSIK